MAGRAAALAGLAGLLLAAACRAARAGELVVETEPVLAPPAEPEGRSVGPAAPAELPPGPPRPDAPALLWRAGRGPMPGLSAAQSARRRTESEAALAEIRAALAEDSPAGRHWLGWLRATLEQPGPGWEEAARVAGALGLRELAPLLLPAVDAEDSPRRRHAARLALHRLLGSWFETAEEARPFLASEQGAATEAFVARLLEQEERASRRLVEVLGRVEAPPAPWPELESPSLRARVAERVGAALAEGRLSAAAELGPLIAALEREDDPAAYHAELEAILVPLSSGPIELELERLFAAFGERVEGAWDGRSLSLSLALGRLAFGEDPAAAAAWLERSLALAGGVLDAALEADRRRGFEDPETLVAAIGSLGTLAERLRALGAGAEVGLFERHTGITDALAAILRDPARAEATRQAAGVALGTFAGPEELGMFVAELGREDLPAGLAHVLLGTLGTLLVERPAPARAGDEATRAALGRVAQMSGSADPDLRRSALALLCDPRLGERATRLDPGFVLARLEREDVPELRRSLAVLLARLGDASSLEPLLALESFPRLAAEEGANAVELDRALAKLAGGDPERLLAAARRLVESGEGAGAAPVRRALALLAGVEDPAGLGDEGRAEAIGWTARLHELGFSLAEGLDERSRGFVEWLLARELPAHPLAEARRAHLAAVLATSRAAAPAGSGGAPQASGPDPAALFARALTLAEAADASDSFRRLVRRDRARHRLTGGLFAAALEDYRALFAEDPAALGAEDLRALGQALAASGTSGAPAPDTPEGRRARGVAAELLLALIERPGWESESPTARLADLGRLEELALACGERRVLARVTALYDELDPLAEEEADPEALPERWRDLFLEEGARSRLSAARERLRAALGGESG